MFNESSNPTNPNNPFAAAADLARTPDLYPIPDPRELSYEPHLLDPETGKPIIDLSYSSANEITTCPRKYQLRKRFYQPDYGSQESFLVASAGTAIHEYIQSRLRGESHEYATFLFYQAYSFKAEADESDYNIRFRSLTPSYHTAVEAYTQMNVRPEHLATFSASDDPSAKTLHGTEFKFAIKLTRPDWKYVYIYRGAVDLTTYTSDGIYMAGDIKTHRNTNEDLSPSYKFSTQLIPYGLVIQYLTGQSLDKFAVRYYSIYVDLIEPKVVPYTFEKSASDVSAWLQSTLLQIANIETYADQHVWPRSLNGCMFFNKPCKFFSICHNSEPDTIQSELLRGGRYPAKAPRSFEPDVTIELELDNT